jgi:hypothetical protein
VPHPTHQAKASRHRHIPQTILAILF